MRHYIQKTRRRISKSVVKQCVQKWDKGAETLTFTDNRKYDQVQRRTDKIRSDKKDTAEKKHKSFMASDRWASHALEEVSKNLPDAGLNRSHHHDDPVAKRTGTKKEDKAQSPIDMLPETGAEDHGAAHYESTIIPFIHKIKKRNELSSGNGGGSADAASGILNAPPSVMAKEFAGINAKLNAGFGEDAKTLSDTTPPVQAGISAANVVPPKRAKLPPKNGKPEKSKWVPPKASLRSDTPKFRPGGAANPQNAESEAFANKARVAAGADSMNAGIINTPGEERVLPKTFMPEEEVKIAATSASVQTGASPEMEEYMRIDMSDDFRRKVDGASARLFRSSLTEPMQTIRDAKDRRDKDRSSAVADTKMAAGELSKKANDEQEEIINSSRGQIGAEKEKSLAESKATLDEFNGKVGAEKQGKIDEINRLIESHEKQANGALEDADKKVADEKNKAEKKKKEEKEKAKKKKKKRHWWQKIGDFFSNIVKKLTKMITSIVNALAKVVKGIISAAKSLANTIISKCTSLVKGLLKTFAGMVKGFLNVALAAFPAIRKRLNAAIDKFVSKAMAAIDQITEQLKNAVNKLCNTLTDIINFAQNAMVSAIQGAMMVFNAIITGNFADLPRIAFMTACNMLGLPGDELWAIVCKAAGQAMEIIKHPAKFLGNLIKAGEKGFGQFVSNIKQHLIRGLMGWLMGQVAQTGITLPKSFDVAGIFQLIRQVLGFTYEYVRQRAVSLIGEKNVKRIEIAVKYLKRLFTEGPVTLFSELKEKAVAAKDAFLSHIEDWAITTVIQKAVMKVTTMLIPGAGFVQAIYSMWQTVQFFLENIKKIAAVVNSLLNSLADISKGAIGSAANYMEKTMVDTLPLVFGWLGKLIGLGNVGQKIKGIIDKLRTPVNTAVDFVIKKAISLGKSIVAKVKRGVAGAKERLKKWWNARKTFTTRDGASHAVYVEGERGGARVVVNPEPKQNVTAFLDKAEKRLPEDEEKKSAVRSDIAAVRSMVKDVNEDMNEEESNSAEAGKNRGSNCEDAAESGEKMVKAQIDEMADPIRRIMEATGVVPEDEMTDEQRIEGAYEEFVGIIKGKGVMCREKIEGELERLKSSYKLTGVTFESNPDSPEIGFYLKEIKSLRLYAVRNDVSGSDVGQMKSCEIRSEGEKKSVGVVKSVAQQRINWKNGFGLVDNQPGLIVQRAMKNAETNNLNKVTPEGKIVLQAQWAFLDSEGGVHLNLTKTDDPTVFILKADNTRYKVIGNASNGDPIVQKTGVIHESYRSGVFPPYRGWTVSSSGVTIAAPFGDGEVSAFHNRGAPKTGTTSAGWGKTKMGDTYDEFIRAVTSGELNDAEIADKLLTLDDTGLTELQKRGASQMHITVYLSEEWRKQGAGKIFRATLRAIQEGKIKFNNFAEYFRFVLSAEEGRKQVARFEDVRSGHAMHSDLSGTDQIVYGCMSPPREDDYHTDDEMEKRKELKSGTRDYSMGGEGQKGWKEPWD